MVFRARIGSLKIGRSEVAQSVRPDSAIGPPATSGVLAGGLGVVSSVRAVRPEPRRYPRPLRLRAHRLSGNQWTPTG